MNWKQRLTRRKTETPIAMVLYRTPGGWRFSVLLPSSIGCGFLPEAEQDCEPELAQAALQAKFPGLAGRRVVWTSEKPDW